MNPETTKHPGPAAGRIRLHDLILLILLISADQVTKWLAVRFPGRNGALVLIPGVFELRYLENRGAAFGLFQNGQIFFILLTLIVAAAVLRVYLRLPVTRRYRSLRAVCVVLTAGAAGNLIDRILYGYVRDFFYIVLIHFPIFNVADICVTGSAAAAVILLFTVYRNDDFTFLKKEL